MTAYVILPSPEAADAVVLFIAATHAQPAWETATRLVIKSPIKRCGKSRLQRVIAETCHRRLRTSNISVAALVRSINEDDPPTLILDEADTVFGPKNKRVESAEDIRGILNAGHERDVPYIRWDITARKREECPTFAMAVIGGIGDMPDTIEDRAVIIAMRRRAPGETVKQWRRKRSIPPLRDLRDRLHECVTGLVDMLSESEPDLPVEDRAADTWEPLVAIADAAGGAWPDRARKACQTMTGEGGPDEATLGERLLGELYDVWGSADGLWTQTIRDRLCAIEEAPWAKWNDGKGLNARDLAKLLKPYGIRSRNVRIGGDQAKGYGRSDLVDAWQRYVPRASQASQASQPDESAGQPWDGNGTDDLLQSVPPSDQRKRADGTDGTDGTAERADHGATPDIVDGQSPWARAKVLAECIVCDNGKTWMRYHGPPWYGQPVHPSCVEEATGTTST
jgi:hypothetical protein